MNNMSEEEMWYWYLKDEEEMYDVNEDADLMCIFEEDDLF